MNLALEKMLVDGPGDSCIVPIYEKYGWYDASSRWVVGTIMMETYYTIFDLDDRSVAWSLSTWWGDQPEEPEQPEEEE
jgi:hypothetical protein